MKNNNTVIVYANPSTGNTECKQIPEVYDIAWQDVDQSQYENYHKIEYVPLCGSDQSNIPTKYVKLIKPYHCFQLKDSIRDTTVLEIVVIHKQPNFNC